MRSNTFYKTLFIVLFFIIPMIYTFIKSEYTISGIFLTGLLGVVFFEFNKDIADKMF